MVSDRQKGLKTYSKTDYNMLEEPVYIRLRFRKTGDLQYISHLDLQKTMGRVLTRAKIPLWYSKGFNPHPKLIFAMPLSVGAESVCEYLDVRVERDIPPSVMMEHLNAELTDEMYITDAYYASTKFSDICWAEYFIEIFTDGAGETLGAEISKLLSEAPLTISKKTKSGMKEIDIIPLIKNADVTFDKEKGTIAIRTVLSASSDSYLNPEQIINVLKDRLGILSGDPMKEEYSITRQRVLLSDGITDFR